METDSPDRIFPYYSYPILFIRYIRVIRVTLLNPAIGTLKPEEHLLFGSVQTRGERSPAGLKNLYGCKRMKRIRECLEIIDP